MDKQTQAYVDAFMADLIRKNPGESEFHQAVREVIESVAPVVMAYPYMREQKVLENTLRKQYRRHQIKIVSIFIRVFLIKNRTAVWNA